jgi:catechol 2,3-dioxygenase-like lactoylglutathione lyase family enzyme
VLQHIALTDVEIDGAPATFDHSSAYGQWGSVMVELIQQHDAGPDPVVGPSGIHHIASFVDDFDAASAALVAGGFPRRLQASTAGGQTFAFHDARPTMGHLIEIYERTDRLARFYAMVRDASLGWTGHDPVRVL